MRYWSAGVGLEQPLIRNTRRTAAFQYSERVLQTQGGNRANLSDRPLHSARVDTDGLGPHMSCAPS